MTKNKKHHQKSDTSIDKRIVACEMSTLFALASASKKENPQRWSKERRTEFNSRIKMIQWLFDTNAYSAAKQWLDWLDSEHHLTGRKYEQNTPKNTSQKDSKKR